MDASNAKTDGTAEYYLNRLIQRAIVEPKSLLKIYEEECQRHPDISVTVSFKEFQSALQRHCMTLQSRPPSHTSLGWKEQKRTELSTLISLDKSIDQKRRKRCDLRRPLQRVTPSILLNAPMENNIANFTITSYPPQTLSVVHVKSEEPKFTSTTAIQVPIASISRPSSVQPPLDEEPPPEFIEMSSNPPRMSDCNGQFSGIGLYQGLASGEKNASKTSGGACKSEPKDTDSSGPVDGTVQSSSPLDKNTTVCAEDISPLNVRCVKCITALVTCAVMPCGHCCLCNICGQTALSLKQVCPVCRKSISTVIGYSNLIYNVYR